MNMKGSTQHVVFTAQQMDQIGERINTEIRLTSELKNGFDRQLGFGQNGNGDGNSKHTDHMGELGSDAIAFEMVNYHTARAASYLTELGQAKLRIELGEFGFCSVCSETIDFRRLLLVPIAKTCWPCKNKKK
jgi:RNA polymerase-binding transcription factor DksA